MDASAQILSQWRGYAADASGVAIGFSKDYLERLEETYREAISNRDPTEDDFLFTLRQVRYDIVAQDAEVEPFYLREGLIKSTDQCVRR